MRFQSFTGIPGLLTFLADSAHLFESVGCKNQGFIYDDKVVALQFHPEVNEKRISLS
jgi:GMP synthase-like glutamine amidotransferase